METLKQGALLLEKQNFVPPEDYLASDLVEGLWNAYQQIYHHKKSKFEDERLRLQERFLKEDINLKKDIAALEDRWIREKPYTGDTSP